MKPDIPRPGPNEDKIVERKATPEGYPEWPEGYPEWCTVIGRQLRRDNTRKPLNHFVDAIEPESFDLGSEQLGKFLEDAGYRVLPVIDMPPPDGYMGTRGVEFFDNLYRFVEANAVDDPDAIQVIRVSDISPCFAAARDGQVRATHDFLQDPLEDNLLYDEGVGPVTKILENNPGLPRVVVLYQVGATGGLEAYGRAIEDVVHGEFKNGFWHGEDLWLPD